MHPLQPRRDTVIWECLARAFGYLHELNSIGISVIDHRASSSSIYELISDFGKTFDLSHLEYKSKFREKL